MFIKNIHMRKEYDHERNRNEPLKKLICQVLDEPDLRIGSVSTFARLFTQFSNESITRFQVNSWLNNNGVPPYRCKLAENLSRAYAEKSILYPEVIKASDLRPKIF
jgi:hypothetical protein